MRRIAWAGLAGLAGTIGFLTVARRSKRFEQRNTCVQAV